MLSLKALSSPWPCLIQTHFHNCVLCHAFFCAPISAIFCSQRDALILFFSFNLPLSLSLFLLFSPFFHRDNVALKIFLITLNFVSANVYCASRGDARAIVTFTCSFPSRTFSSTRPALSPPSHFENYRRIFFSNKWRIVPLCFSFNDIFRCISNPSFRDKLDQRNPKIIDNWFSFTRVKPGIVFLKWKLRHVAELWESIIFDIMWQVSKQNSIVHCPVQTELKNFGLRIFNLRVKSVFSVSHIQKSICIRMFVTP